MMNSISIGLLASVWLQLAPATPAAPSPPTSTPAAPPVAPDAPVPAAPSTAALLASAATPNRPVLALDGAERTAVENQPNIRQARSATAAAAGQIEQARAGYLPQVNGTASWTYGSQEGTSAARSPCSTPSVALPTSPAAPVTVSQVQQMMISSAPCGAMSNFATALSASQLIYDFGQTTEKWKSSERAVEALQATETTSRNLVLFNVRSAFFTARADRALVGVQAETLANEQKHLLQTEGFVQAGTQPEVALAQARTDVANAKVQLIAAENSYDIARAQLNMAMGVTTNVDYDVADRGLGSIDGEDDPSEQLVARALSARPELASLTKQHEADVLTIHAYERAYGPSLAGIGGVGLFGGDVYSLTAGWQVGLSLTWPILLGGLTRGQIHQAEGNLGVVDAQLEAERLQVRLDVEQARLSIRSAKVSIGATEEALLNAREQLRLAEGRFSQGVGSIIELGDAQVAVTAAGAQRVQADFNLAIARAQLLLALGRP
jgi:outer membrane protein